MEDADRQKIDKRIGASAVAGSALLAGTALLTGPLAVACGILGGAMIAAPAACIAFASGNRRDSNPNREAWPEANDVEQPPAQPASLQAPSAQPAGHWTERAASAHAVKRGR